MTQDPPRMISVLSSTDGCVGFLRSAGPKDSPLTSMTSTQRSKRLRPRVLNSKGEP